MRPKSEILDSNISRSLSVQNVNSETTQVEKTPTVVIRKIRDAILDEIFKPGEWLPELDLATRFQVSRSPVREALLALEKEGTVITEPYKGAVVKPLSPEEVLDIAELRLAVITLAAKRLTVISPRLLLTLLIGSQNKWPAATAPKNTLNA